jgi:hypothetical protein
MDATTKLNIARTKERIAILRNLIGTLKPKGAGVSEHRRMLAAEERYLASGCAPPQARKPLARTGGTASGWIIPPGSKR